MHKFFTFVLIYFTWISMVRAACDCTNCPEPLGPGFGGGVISEIQVSGSTNPIIGSNGQGLRSVKVHLIHASLEEIDVILRKQGGGPFAFSRLIEQNGNSTSDTVTLNICFINCDEVAEPDTGFPETFDSGAGYSSDSVYTGSYFPSQGNNGCFNNKFNGLAVNGTWELAISGSPTFGGTLVNWELDFYDNDGTTCEPFCIIPISSCLANGGIIEVFPGTYCEGSSDLNFNIPVDFGGNEPNPNLYDYTYVITDENDIIVDFLEGPDLTSFEPGEYNICGLSFLQSDLSLIPGPDGTYSILDLQSDIDEEVFCADLSSDCFTITIIPEPEPAITGPTEVCINQLVTFTLEGLDVDDWTFGSVSGPFNELIFDLPEIFVNWALGPPTRTICYEYSNACGSGEVCITVDIIQPPVIEINGPFNVCEGVSYVYSLNPPAPPGSTWEITLVGGVLIDVDDDSFEVEWFENGGANTAQVILTGGPCGNSDPVTIAVNLTSPDPPVVEVPFELCLDEIGTASVDFDPQIDDYIWSGDGITILSGQGTNGPVEFLADQLGMVEICIEIVTACGPVDPVCEFIEISPEPEPEIESLDPQCDFEFTLTATTTPGSFGLWTQTGGPGGVDILNPNGITTEVVVIQPGLYTFEFTEDNGLCEGTAVIEVEILPPPDVEEGELNCAGGEYQIELIFTGGTEPYFVDGEEISGSEFLSPSIQSGSPYFFIVSDANGCETIAEGIIECPCVSDAGSMSQDLLVACISTGETVTADSDGNAVFDIDDIGLFVLHDLAGTILGNIFEINADGVFGFQPGMIPGQTYYISFVVGSELNGSYDPDDPCLSVAPGQPVVFFDDPEVEILPVDPLCDLGTLQAVVSADVTEVLWSNISGPGASSILTPDQALTDVLFGPPGTYVFSFLAANPACSVTEEIAVEVLEPISIENLQINCLNLLEFTAAFTIVGGDGEYTVNPSGTLIGSEFTTEVLDPDQVYFFSVEDNSGCATEFTIGPADCLCDNEAGSMSPEVLVACISQGETVTADYNGDGILLPGDISTFVLHDNPGPDLGNVFDSNEDGVFGFVAGMTAGEVYYISHVVGTELNGSYDPDDPCLQVSPGQPVIFYDDPVFELFSLDSVCGFMSMYEVSTGSPADLITWESLSWPGEDPPVINDPTGPITAVEVFEPGSYQFALQLENPACLLRDTFETEFLGLPLISLPDTECISSDLFTVSFEVSGNGDDFELDLPGSLAGNIFNSDFLEDGTIYEFTVVDAAGCANVFSIGPVDCSCISTAGSMGTDTLFFCETGGIVLLDFENNGNTALLDTAFFVIHQGNGTNLVDPVYFTDQSTFELPDTLQAGIMYYVSQIVTSPDADGQPDPESSCLRISPGQPLFIYELPQFNIAGNLTNCFGPAELTIESGGGGSLELLENNTGGGVDFRVEGETIVIEPESFGIITLEYSEFNGLCQASDTIEIEFLELPAFSDLMVECIGEEFVVNFETTGGQGPYVLNGDPLSGSSFSSDTVPSGSQLQFVVVDAQGCVSDTLFISEDCDCEGEAGTIGVAQVELCEGEDLLIADLETSGINVPEDFVLVYLLLEEPDISSTNIVVQITGSVLDWSGDLETNRIYYIVAVVSTLDGAEINLDDACLSVSNAVPVIWNALPRLTLSGNAEVCLGDETAMTLELDGPLPMDVVLQNNFGELIEITIENSLQQIVYRPEMGGDQIWEIASTDSGCPAILEGNFNLVVREPADFQIMPPPEICNNSLFGSALNLNELLDAPRDGIWSWNGDVIADGLIDFDGFDEGEYILEFSTEGFEAPCPGSIETVVIQVVECNCPEVLLPELLEICANSAAIDLQDISGETIEGRWTLENPQGLEGEPEILNNTLTLDTNLEGRYELIFSLTDSLPEGCSIEWTVELNIEGLKSAGNVAAIPVLCEGQMESIALGSLLTGEDEGGVWLNEQGDISEPEINTDSLSTGANIFIYRVEGDLCPDAESRVEIIVSAKPVISVDWQDPLCFGDENGEIAAVVENTENGPYQLLINGQAQSGLIAGGLSTGTYGVEVEDNNGCVSDLIEVQLQQAEDYFVNLGEDIEADPGEFLLIEATTNVPEAEIQSIGWIAAGETIETGTLILNYQAVSNAVMTIRLTTDRGCVLQDFINIKIKERTVYLPNVFRPSSGISPNAAFGPFGIEAVESVTSFQIFDRWGNRVHEVSNISPDSPQLFWDGKIKEQLAGEGVYVYQLVYTDLAGREVVRVGDVALIR